MCNLIGIIGNDIKNDNIMIKFFFIGKINISQFDFATILHFVKNKKYKIRIVDMNMFREKEDDDTINSLQGNL